MKFKSEFFDDICDLVSEKDILLEQNLVRRERLKLVRQFYNGLATMSDAEAEEEGRTEITNHMMGYRNIQQIETQNYSIYTSSNTLADITVDTDNPELDYTLSTILTQVINQAIYSKGKFGNLWRSVSGELPLASVAPLVFDSKQGWCPRMAPNMLFPKGTGYLAEDVTYAFAPRELTLADLKQLSQAVKGETSRFINKGKIDDMIEALKEQVRLDSSEAKSSRQDDSEFGSSVTDADNLVSRERKTTLNAWYFYEVKHDENGSYVSSTLFTERTQIGKVELGEEVIAYREKAYDTPESWLHFIVSDSEIGGVKTVDTAKGIAELNYNSDADREELLNLVIEGSKERAKPKYKMSQGASIDSILEWNPQEDSLVPEGIDEFTMRSSSNDLLAPFGILGQGAAQNSAGSVSNVGRGGENRNQTLERQRNTGVVINNRIADVYKSLDILLAEIVYRFLVAKVRPGTEGYQDIMWVRTCLDQKIKQVHGIDYKELAKKYYGRFKYLNVKAIRAIGDGSREQELDTAEWLMSQLGNYDPNVRPYIIHRATTAVTRDPDLADFVVRKPQIILNTQKVIAENEFDTIRRRAAAGMRISPSPDDIHQDHLPVHILDLETMVASHQARPWDNLDVLQFAAMVDHVGEHLQILLGNKTTNNEAKQFTQRLQQVVQAAQAIVKDVDERDNVNQDLTPKEQADIELRTAELQLKAQKFGLDIEAFRDLKQSRDTRMANIQRGQYAREVATARQLDIQEKAVDKQNEQQSANNTGTE